MPTTLSPDEIRDVNTRYHDVAAASYDAKWGIDFGDVGMGQVVGKLRKLVGAKAVAGSEPLFGRALEIGAGTGYFSLNLMRAGLIGEVTCTDISPGMVATLAGNAQRLGLEHVSATRADAESLPFGDESFDIVLGHAVLHHLPDLDRAFAEFFRVLRPGGLIVFAGEPSRVGDRIARGPKRLANRVAPLWRTAIRARPASADDGHGATHEHTWHSHDQALDQGLEHCVDIHTFDASDLSRLAADAGFASVQVRGEELLANWFGWFNRTLEASADQADIPMLWRRYAFRGYLALQRLDVALLEPRLPAAIFYNLLLSARRPDSP